MENKTKLCMSLSPTFNLTELEQIQKFNEHGIDGFFALYKDDRQIFDIAEFAEKKGSFFQSVHAKHHPMREMWFGGEHLESMMIDLKNTIICTSRAGIDRVIMHVYTGFYGDKPTTEGVKRVGELLEVAEKHNIKLCFENLEGSEFLDAVLGEYSWCDNARFCYDTGHENCYATHWVVDKYKDKITALHINDNMGVRGKDLNGADDLHLLPFDGNVDFNRVVSLIKNANMQHELTFEFKFSKDPLSDKYKNMNFDEYLTLAKERMQKLAKML